MYTDTPFPQEEPAGENPPDGAAIHYYLQQPASGEVMLEIADASGKIIRRFSSKDAGYTLPGDLNIPTYWIRPQEKLSGERGAHRFVWDLRYAPLETNVSYPIAAVYQNTAPETASPWVLPGNYTITLIVNGKAYSQPLLIKMDPRVTLTQEQLTQLHNASLTCHQARESALSALKEIGVLKKQIKEWMSTDRPDKEKLALLENQLQEIEGAGGRRGRVPATNQPGFATLESRLATIGGIWQEADRMPTRQSMEALKENLEALGVLQSRWGKLKQELSNLQ
jgi:hypothetical protein